MKVTYLKNRKIPKELKTKLTTQLNKLIELDDEMIQCYKNIIAKIRKRRDITKEVVKNRRPIQHLKLRGMKLPKELMQ